MVPPHGLEPRTYWLQISCSTSWAIGALFGAGDQDRTDDNLLGRQELYHWATPAISIYRLLVKVLYNSPILCLTCSPYRRCRLNRIIYNWRSDWESNPVNAVSVLRISNPLHYHPAPAPLCIWWVLRDSNSEPLRYERRALTNWAKDPCCLAGSQGFEPWEDFHPRRFSRPVLSTTQPAAQTLAPCAGLEPATFWLTVKRSTNWANKEQTLKCNSRNRTYYRIGFPHRTPFPSPTCLSLYNVGFLLQTLLTSRATKELNLAYCLQAASRCCNINYTGPSSPFM